jgi:hypothetical protein
MSIKPGSSILNFTSNSGNGSVYIDELSYTELFQNFDRLEYSNRRLREAPTTTGALPLIVTGFGNQPIQLLTTCTGDVPRPLGPDDANIAAIKQRWNIFRFTIKGAINNQSVVDILYNLNLNHLIRLNAFDLYLGELSMDLSITYLETVLQPLTFALLTTTDLTLSGPVLDTTYSNLLLSEFSAIAEYEAPISGSAGSTVLYSFTATIESRTLNAQGPLGT